MNDDLAGWVVVDAVKYRHLKTPGVVDRDRSPSAQCCMRVPIAFAALFARSREAPISVVSLAPGQCWIEDAHEVEIAPHAEDVPGPVTFPAYRAATAGVSTGEQPPRSTTPATPGNDLIRLLMARERWLQKVSPR